MRRLVSLEEVRRRSILYLLYFYLFILGLYIVLGFLEVIQLLEVQHYINIALLALLLFLLWLYRSERIDYQPIVYILLVVGLFDTLFILNANYYNELRILWLLSLIPYAYLYGGKVLGLFTSVVTFVVPLLLFKHLGYTTQGMLTYEVTNLLVSSASFFFIYHFERMSEIIHKKQLQLSRYATVDFLTETLNRRGFFEAAEGVERGVVAIFDLDNLKVINDTYGHKVGDEYIRFFAYLLRQSIRGEDILARFGGDEFIVLFKDASIDTIEGWAKRFYEKLDEHFFHFGKNSLIVEVSAGFASLQGDLQEAIEKADVALYEAKRERGGYTLFR